MSSALAWALLEETNRARGWLPDDDLIARSEVDDWDDDGDAATEPVGNRTPTSPPFPRDWVGIARPSRRRAGTRGTRRSLLWVTALVAAFLLVAWTWFDRPQVEPAPVTPAGNAPSVTSAAEPAVGEVAETSLTVVVSVVGSVLRPGLVTLASGARVAAAVEAAGGLLPEADPSTSSRRRRHRRPADRRGCSRRRLPARRHRLGVGRSGNLNSATVAELDALPGVGPVLAQRIVDHREQGPFASVDELDDVPGIGPARAAELAELVTV